MLRHSIPQWYNSAPPSWRPPLRWSKPQAPQPLYIKNMLKIYRRLNTLLIVWWRCLFLLYKCRKRKPIKTPSIKYPIQVLKIFTDIYGHRMETYWAAFLTLKSISLNNLSRFLNPLISLQEFFVSHIKQHFSVYGLNIMLSHMLYLG